MSTFDVVSAEMTEARHLTEARAIWWADRLTLDLQVLSVVIVPHEIDTRDCYKCLAMINDYALLTGAA